MRTGPEGAVLPKTAEIELSVLAKQCLAEHVTSTDNPRKDIQAWTKQRDDCNNTVNWRFTTDDAWLSSKNSIPLFYLVKVLSASTGIFQGDRALS